MTQSVRKELQRPVGYPPSEISALINYEVVEQHAEETAFQWFLRDQAVSAPHYTLPDMIELDGYIEANLDGLRAARETGWRFCEEALVLRGPGEIFAGAVLAFESENEAKIGRVFQCDYSSLLFQRPLISALGWLEFDLVRRLVRDCFSSSDPFVRRIGVGAAAAHRKDPKDFLKKALADSEAKLRSRALKAAGELGRKDLIPPLLEHLGDPDPDCRFYGAWSAARLGDRSKSVLTVLRDFSERMERYSESAVQIAVRCLPLSTAKSWFRHLAKDPDTRRHAIVAAGAIGDPELVPDLIGLMSDQKLARVAGESLINITGVDFVYEDLETDQPEDFEVGPTDNPDDDDVETDPDEDLLWPDVDLVASWWDRVQGNYHAGHRYLRGKPINRETLLEAIKVGLQRQRIAAALELALSAPERPLFEVRAPARRQQLEYKQWIS